MSDALEEQPLLPSAGNAGDAKERDKSLADSKKTGTVVRLPDKFRRGLTNVAQPTAPEGLKKQTFQNTDPIRDPFTASANPEEVGILLTQLRESQSMSKRAAAKLLGRDEKAIRQLESGQHSQTISKIQQYAEVLGYEVHITAVPARGR